MLLLISGVISMSVIAEFLGCRRKTLGTISYISGSVLIIAQSSQGLNRFLFLYSLFLSCSLFLLSHFSHKNQHHLFLPLHLLHRKVPGLSLSHPCLSIKQS
ncbi:hypothetical protein C2G38_2102986 [Gigaspora rosea]|uniref:Uncharacterized protein n=1 Tax=Gigaspora rosea TaxID=44941 RepID=A0A397UQ27_9GLOM|nr:hypothetical protein C2G38_2102986 [Gigaspora rosea]